MREDVDIDTDTEMRMKMVGRRSTNIVAITEMRKVTMIMMMLRRKRGDTDIDIDTETRGTMQTVPSEIDAVTETQTEITTSLDPAIVIGIVTRRGKIVIIVSEDGKDLIVAIKIRYSRTGNHAFHKVMKLYDVNVVVFYSTWRFYQSIFYVRPELREIRFEICTPEISSTCSSIWLASFQALSLFQQLYP